MSKLEELQNMIDQSNHIVFFGGAGVSTDSGIPDFRSSKGIFNEDLGMQVSPEELISYSYASKNPKSFFDFYLDKMVFPDAKPNQAHKYLADLEASGKRISIVTQNIDGLHEIAGSNEIYNLHGSVVHNYCVECGRDYSLDELEKDADGIPRCPHDQAVVRPDIVLYEEQLDQDVISSAIQSIASADMMIIAGTSLVVQPAAGLVNYFNGDHLAVINKTPLSIHNPNVLTFENSINHVFDELEIK